VGDAFLGQMNDYWFLKDDYTQQKKKITTLKVQTRDVTCTPVFKEKRVQHVQNSWRRVVFGSLSFGFDHCSNNFGKTGKANPVAGRECP
jgi:hypothetical protein